MIIINLQGIVIKSTGSWYIVQTEDNQLFNCKIKANLKHRASKAPIR